MSSPIDAGIKDEILKTVKAVCATFTTQYVKQYALALVKKLEREARESPLPYQLLEREVIAFPEKLIPLATNG
jgi:hypothetical protein